MQLTFSFSCWHIEASEGILGRQYDNLAHQIVVVGSLPEDYTWDMLVECRGNYNIIPLTVNSTGASATLTADQLALSGYYDFQLRGTQSNVIHHTNSTQVFIPDTIVGPGTWPVLPTEFSEAEAAIKELNAHPPTPSEDGYWMIWDTEKGEYVTTTYAVAPVSAAQNSNGSWTITIKNADGTTSSINIPATALASIELDQASEKDMTYWYGVLNEDVKWGWNKEETMDAGFYSKLNQNLLVLLNPAGRPPYSAPPSRKAAAP